MFNPHHQFRDKDKVAKQLVAHRATICKHIFETTNITMHISNPYSMITEWLKLKFNIRKFDNTTDFEHAVEFWPKIQSALKHLIAPEPTPVHSPPTTPVGKNKKNRKRTPEQLAARRARRAARQLLKQQKRREWNTNLAEQKQQPTPNADSDAFLNSYAWRVARMKVIKRDGKICACCGNSTINGSTLNVDHIKPRKHYPELALDLNNLQILCGECNHGKGNWDETDWREPELEHSAVEDILYTLTPHNIHKLKPHELKACLLYVVQQIKPPDQATNAERDSPKG